MLIWRISESLRSSQNFVKNWKFSWPAVLSKISDFDHLFKTFILDLWVNCNSQNGILKWFLCWFEGFLEVWGWVKILSKIIIEDFHDRGRYRNFRFWPIFRHSLYWPVSQLQVSKWHSRVFLSWFEGFLKVWGWVKILSKIENFHDRSP